MLKEGIFQISNGRIYETIGELLFSDEQGGEVFMGLCIPASIYSGDEEWFAQESVETTVKQNLTPQPTYNSLKVDKQLSDRSTPEKNPTDDILDVRQNFNIRRLTATMF